MIWKMKYEYLVNHVTRDWLLGYFPFSFSFSYNKQWYSLVTSNPEMLKKGILLQIILGHSEKLRRIFLCFFLKEKEKNEQEYNPLTKSFLSYGDIYSYILKSKSHWVTTDSYIKSGNEYAHNCKLLFLSSYNTVLSPTLSPSGFADLELAYNHGIYLKGPIWCVSKPIHFGSDSHNEVKISSVARICEVCSTSHCQIFSTMNCGHHAVQLTYRNHLFYVTDQHESIPSTI